MQYRTIGNNHGTVYTINQTNAHQMLTHMFMDDLNTADMSADEKTKIEEKFFREMPPMYTFFDRKNNEFSACTDIIE